MKKERIYPNYTDIFTYTGKSVIIYRKCIDNLTRYINTVYFKISKVCLAYFLDL
jgi:hypothetical protein